MRKPMLALLWGLTLAIALPACREPRLASELIAELRSPDAKERRSAADGLRLEEGVPRQAIGPLLEAISHERDKRAYGAMLITLGRSGVPEAWPIIDARLPDRDRDMRRWVAQALKDWLIATGRVPPDHRFPEGYPYGQPGYPPPLPEGD